MTKQQECTHDTVACLTPSQKASNSFALALSFKWTIALVGGDETRRKLGSSVRRAIAAPVHTSSKGRQWPQALSLLAEMWEARLAADVMA